MHKFKANDAKFATYGRYGQIKAVNKAAHELTDWLQEMQKIWATQDKD